MLVDRGAKINIKRSEGNTLYTILFRGYLKVAEMLIDRGADVNARGGLYGNAL
jgi:hypothetical protein